MLKADNLLEALTHGENDGTSDNDDYDFGDVLKYYITEDSNIPNVKLRCSDGKERYFTFND